MPRSRKMNKKRAPVRRAQRGPPRLPKDRTPLVYAIERSVGTASMSAFNTSVSVGAGCVVTPYVDLGTSAIQGLHYMGLAYAFTLADLPSVSTFVNLFERYKLNRVDVCLERMATVSSSTAVAGSGNAHGVVHTVIDYDDNVAPLASEVGANAMRARDNYRCDTLMGPVPLKWSLVPRLGLPAYTGSVFNGYTSTQPQWIDSASTGVLHYGMKWLFEVVNPTAAFAIMSVKFTFKYHLTFCDLQ